MSGTGTFTDTSGPGNFEYFLVVNGNLIACGWVHVPTDPTPEPSPEPSTPTPTSPPPTAPPPTPTVPAPPPAACAIVASTGTTFDFTYANIPAGSSVVRNGVAIQLIGGSGSFSDSPGGPDGTVYTYAITSGGDTVAVCGEVSVVSPPTPTPPPSPETECDIVASTGTTFDFTYSDVPAGSSVVRNGVEIQAIEGSGSFSDTPGGPDGTVYTYTVTSAGETVAVCGEVSVINPPQPVCEQVYISRSAQEYLNAIESAQYEDVSALLASDYESGLTQELKADLSGDQISAFGFDGKIYVMKRVTRLRLYEYDSYTDYSTNTVSNIYGIRENPYIYYMMNFVYDGKIYVTSGGGNTPETFAFDSIEDLIAGNPSDVLTIQLNYGQSHTELFGYGGKIYAMHSGNTARLKEYDSLDDLKVNNGTMHYYGDQDGDQAFVGLFGVGRGFAMIAFNGDCTPPVWHPDPRTTASPIGIDVDGSGAVERIDGEFSLDITGNGEVETLNEWFASTEGILIDSSIAIEDGAITGQHLFGDMDGTYADGFEKLALLDVNADGQVAGAEMANLAIWTDANSNAKLDAGETSSLAAHSIVSLSTSHTAFASQATLVDGSSMYMEDLWFPIVLAPAPAQSLTSSISMVVLLSIAGLGVLFLIAMGVGSTLHRREAELAA